MIRQPGQVVEQVAVVAEQFRLKKEYLDAGKPVLSMDTKKKELLGNFYRDGVTDGVEPIIVLV